MDNNHELSELLLSLQANLNTVVEVLFENNLISETEFTVRRNKCYVELKNYIYGNDEISLHTAD